MPLRKKNKKIMVWLDTSRASDRGLLSGIIHYSQVFGPWTFYHPYPSYLDTSLQPSKTELLLDCLKTWKANGLIAMMNDPDIANEITTNGISLVIIPTGEQLVEGYSNVCENTGAIGRLGAEYLLERGFRNFAFCGFFQDYWSEVRSQSFSDTVRQQNYGIHIYEPPKRQKGFRWEYEIPYMVKWLKSLPKPIALMACNDERGQHVLDACKVAGLNVPNDIAVLGVDNDDMICELTDPPMSSVVLNFKKCGYEAANTLARLMQGERISEKIAVEPLTVASRQSTNLLAIQDRELADVLKYIREHVREKINVNEIVKISAMSRHVLYRKFRNALSRSPHEEIVRVRMNEMANMLITSRLSISEIAYRMGEQDDKHISRCFRRVMGMSPAMYRKKYAVENL
jgi:LacI family transcriptional regulator